MNPLIVNNKYRIDTFITLHQLDKMGKLNPFLFEFMNIISYITDVNQEKI